MSKVPKKQRFTVKYKPIEGGKFFDIKGPTKKVLRAIDPRKDSFWPMMILGSVVFSFLFTLSVFTGGSDLIKDTQPVAHAGFDSLKEGVSAALNQDLEGANQLFKDSQFSFEEMARNTTLLTSQANHLISRHSYLDSAQKMIDTGIKVSKIGQDLTSFASEAKGMPEQYLKASQEGRGSQWVQGLREKQGVLKEIELETSLVLRNLQSLTKQILPKEFKVPLEEAKYYTEDFLVALKSISDHFEAAFTLLGETQVHRYLVLFQNNHERRATGGFLGSYLLVDIKSASIVNMKTEDIYRTDYKLKEYVQAPPGISEVAKQWYMRDANYSPDFPTSAEQLKWFLEKSEGPDVDTVIAIDQNVAEALLEITGPIKVPGFPYLITAENFNDLFSYNIEAKLSKTNTPKQLLIDFIPIFRQKLFEVSDYQEIVSTVAELASAKHIQVHSENPSVQAIAERWHVDGRMISPEPRMDFLSVISTSIGGNKSDAYIQTHLDHRTEISGDGEVIDHLTIQKTHQWESKDFALWEKLIRTHGTGKEHKNTLRFIQGEGPNLDYMRVYIPKGSRLVGIDGIDLAEIEASEDLSYSVLAFKYGPVAPGETKEVRLSYKLPYKLSVKHGDVYRFIAQKQAGTENTVLKKSIESSEALKIVKSYPVSEEAAFELSPYLETSFDHNQIFLSFLKRVQK